MFTKKMKPQIQLPTILEKFLRKEKVLTRFMKNTLEQNYSRKGVINITSIDIAFIWARTKEGHVFWENLDDKFDINFK